MSTGSILATRIVVVTHRCHRETGRRGRGDTVCGALEPDGACDLRQDGEECRAVRAGGELEPYSSHADRRPRAFVRRPDQPTIVRPNHTK